MSNPKKEKFKTELEGWYNKNRDDYLKDYLQKIEARNKYLLLGAGGGILSVFKFLDLFKNNKWIQGLGWIFMCLMLLLGATTLFSYIYGARSSATFIDLVTKVYKNKIDNPDDNSINLIADNKDFKKFKIFESSIIVIMSITTILSVLICAFAFYIIIFKEQESNKTMKTTKKEVILPKENKNIGLEKSFIPTVLPTYVSDVEEETPEEIEK